MRNSVESFDFCVLACLQVHILYFLIAAYFVWFFAAYPECGFSEATRRSCSSRRVNLLAGAHALSWRHCQALMTSKRHRLSGDCVATRSATRHGTGQSDGLSRSARAKGSTRWTHASVYRAVKKPSQRVNDAHKCSETVWLVTAGFHSCLDAYRRRNGTLHCMAVEEEF